jgi:hypothetical protein
VSATCDFCSQPDPTWVYPARSFDAPALAWGSSGGWAACDPCSSLIEQQAWAALARRTIELAPSARILASLGRRERRLALKATYQLHQEFQRQRRPGMARMPFG